MMLSSQQVKEIMAGQETYYPGKGRASFVLGKVMDYIGNNIKNTEWSGSGNKTECKNCHLSYELKTLCENKISGINYVTNTIVKLALVLDGFEVRAMDNGMLRNPQISDIADSGINFIWRRTRLNY